MIKCPFKESDSCCKQFWFCVLAIFLTILGVALALKIITLILCIFPGSIHENTWIVITSIILVFGAARCYVKGYFNCFINCCGCKDKEEKNDKKCCKEEK
ncbi:MAG: hypothetical protein Kow0076_0590 [Francisella sp.]